MGSYVLDFTTLITIELLRVKTDSESSEDHFLEKIA